LVTAMPFWIPAGVVIGAAAVLLGHSTSDESAQHRSSAQADPLIGGGAR
jgi:hypothetical protein